MKSKISILFLMVVVIATSCLTPDGPLLEVQNPHNQPVLGKSFVVERSTVDSLLKGEWTDNSAIKVTDQRERLLISQLDDVDGDGQWDELVFQANFNQDELLQLSFEVVDESTLGEMTHLTNVRFARKESPDQEVSDEARLKSTDSPTISAIYQMEGPAWENDVVGFRNYYDARNGMDIFGKRTSEMVLDKAGINDQNYHELDEWGMDILKVGNSLGAGAIAIGIGDEIYRVGPAEAAGFHLISEGPVRSVFDLTFNGVPAGDRTYDVVHRISIYAGDHFYRSQVWVEDLQGDEMLYTGIVDMHELPVFEETYEGVKIFGTYGNQGFNEEILGLGVLIPDDQFLHYKAAPESGEGVIETHLTALQLTENAPSEYAFAAGWELQDAGFTNDFYFKEVLKKSAIKLNNENWSMTIL
ncbi:DUF4861 family protein [Geofilum rubicundum]|uniref:Glycosyl hydrolase, family 88 n=1 Tax=Geofilum rubicundum JCM 15548 TaxID=1236989 RepID=A0A0E9LYI5_9BACT|nr:DUF4861 family protein [Geofilum rubicundum]GAO30196.1 glycosyl hydrolase, family 88 [Geofilum rubicundum JCM 15548]